jgi:hypothetical protein
MDTAPWFAHLATILKKVQPMADIVEIVTCLVKPALVPLIKNVLLAMWDTDSCIQLSASSIVPLRTITTLLLPFAKIVFLIAPLVGIQLLVKPVKVASF